MKTTLTIWNRAKQSITLCMLMVVCLVASANHIPGDRDVFSYDREHIQIALILDTSGSMDRLIEQARAEFWYMIDEIYNEYEYDYAPILEVALIEYGRSTYGWNNRFMNVVVPFTEDHDWVADALYDLRTGGKREFAAEAVALAGEELRWNPNPYAMKSIYIAGNERFGQGELDYREVLRWTKRQGIITHTIYAGDHRDGIQDQWEHAARIGGGTYSNILLDQAISYYDTNYDNDIYALNSAWNATCIPYGPRADFYWQRYVRQDRWAYNYGRGYGSTRIIVKSRPTYVNANWDLVDAIACGRVRLRDIPVNQLPSNMRRMNYREREAYIAQMSRKRADLRDRINHLSQDRRNYISKREVSSPRNVKRRSLDRAITSSVKKKVRDPNRSVSSRPHLNRNNQVGSSPRTGKRPAVVEGPRKRSTTSPSRSTRDNQVGSRPSSSTNGRGTATGSRPSRSVQGREVSRDNRSRNSVRNQERETINRDRQNRERVQRENETRIRQQREEQERRAVQARERAHREQAARAEQQRKESQARERERQERAARAAKQRAEQQKRQVETPSRSQRPTQNRNIQNRSSSSRSSSVSTRSKSNSSRSSNSAIRSTNNSSRSSSVSPRSSSNSSRTNHSATRSKSNSSRSKGNSARSVRSVSSRNKN